MHDSNFHNRPNRWTNDEPIWRNGSSQMHSENDGRRTSAASAPRTDKTKSSQPHLQDSLTAFLNAGKAIVLVFDSSRKAEQELKAPRLDKPQKPDAENPALAFSSVTIHTTSRNTASNDPLDVLQSAVATILPADVSIADELDFDKTDEFVFSKKKNYEVHNCVKIAISILRSTVSLFDTDAKPSRVLKSFFCVR